MRANSTTYLAAQGIVNTNIDLDSTLSTFKGRTAEVRNGVRLRYKLLQFLPRPVSEHPLQVTPQTSVSFPLL